jgi:hypothetical protein
MDKIWLKSGEITQKHDFTLDFTRSAQNNNCWPLFPPAPGVNRVLAYWLLHSTHYTQSHTEQKQTINTFFLHRLSHNTAEEKIKIPKSTTAFFILIFLLSAVQVPIINHRSTTNNPLSHQPP